MFRLACITPERSKLVRTEFVEVAWHEFARVRILNYVTRCRILWGWVRTIRNLVDQTRRQWQVASIRRSGTLVGPPLLPCPPHAAIRRSSYTETVRGTTASNWHRRQWARNTWSRTQRARNPSPFGTANASKKAKEENSTIFADGVTHG